MAKVNKLLKVQDMLYNQMKRLDDNEIMDKGYGKREIMRSGALSQSVCAYIKSVNTNIKIKELCKNNSKMEKELLKELGVVSED